MDTEKYTDIQDKIDHGLSPNDEGPYYHHAWWEAYKGSVKGKFGGLVIGALIGGIMGTAVAAIAAIAAPTGAIGLGLGAAIIGAFASAGGMFGVHEFSDIGKVTGAVAASHKEAEVRMKLYEEGRFNELKQDIAEIKALMRGDSKAASSAAQQSVKIRREADLRDEKSYRTTHYAQLEPDKKNRFAFWKVVGIGLGVGLAAGALFAATGAAEQLLKGIIEIVAEASGQTAKDIGKHYIYAVSMGTFGAMGASFGLNRDLFRRIFDQTDLMFKGIVFNEKIKEKQIEAGQEITEKRKNGKHKNGNGNGHHSAQPQPDESSTLPTPAYESPIDYPKSDTYHRDRLLAAAEKALLSFDHTRATPH